MVKRTDGKRGVIQTYPLGLGSPQSVDLCIVLNCCLRSYSKKDKHMFSNTIATQLKVSM